MPPPDSPTGGASAGGPDPTGADPVVHGSDAPPGPEVGSAYLAAPGLEAPLLAELARRGARVGGWHGRLLLSPDPPVPAAWALDRWTAPRLLPAPSVRAAADALRAMGRNWSLHAGAHHRRCALIASRLPPLAARPLRFPEPAPASHLGGWTLLAPDLLLASPLKSSPFVEGTPRFVEDRTGPPSRAYLKLWEALTVFGRHPAPGELCLDLGASPGGWTAVLAGLGARVVAVDRAPLDPAVAALPGVTERLESAFGLDPHAFGPVDWLCSDVVAYPARLLALVHAWIAAGMARRIVLTVKFQGEADWPRADDFAAIPGRAPVAPRAQQARADVSVGAAGGGVSPGWRWGQGKEGSSFSEEKEAKRLCPVWIEWVGTVVLAGGVFGPLLEVRRPPSMEGRGQPWWGPLSLW